MKRLQGILAILILVTLSSYGEVLTPVKWKNSIKQIDNTTWEITFSAAIDPGWHIYGMDIPEGGPVATTFHFTQNGDYELIDKVKPDKAPVVKFDNSFAMELGLFGNKPVFRQKVKLLSTKATVSGYIEYMTCDDSRCLPPTEEEFEFNITSNSNSQTNTISKTSPKKPQNEPDTEKGNTTDTPKPFGFVENSQAPIAPPAEIEDMPVEENHKTLKEGLSDPVKSYRSLWELFIKALGYGLLALLTPCVFPMIPMTVSFFMHGAKSKIKARFNAIYFGVSIVAIYVFLGTITSLIFGADTANFLSTHWLPNILFFLIFMVFAASFFGMFEIVLPSAFVNKIDSKADKGGLLGPFFMALTLAVVSFSCTGPLVGSVLVDSAGGAFMEPIVGMLGFSIAFALPFTLFALFPSLLKNLPKSGGWLNSVKVILGFIELALGLKFLSIADQTYHWGILDREVYLALWVVIFSLMGVYLLGKIKFSHDSEVKYIGFPRLALAIITFSFVVYLIPGMFGAPLKALAGYLPPQNTIDFDLSKITTTGAETIIPKEKRTAKYSDFLHMSHGLTGYFDLEEALAASKKENKPILLDFTGHGCVNCREMEANVWSDPNVLKALREEFIILSLYVDDKTKLPEEDWIVSEYDGKTKKTLGKINADYQISKYRVNAQPYYVIMDSNENMLVEPRAYDLDINKYLNFLESGIKAYKDQQ